MQGSRSTLVVMARLWSMVLANLMIDEAVIVIACKELDVTVGERQEVVSLVSLLSRLSELT